MFSLVSHPLHEHVQSIRLHAPPTTAFDLWQTDSTIRIASGCKGIDTMLGGGFASGIITEICGEASVGKTQLVLQLLLQVSVVPWR